MPSTVSTVSEKTQNVLDCLKRAEQWSHWHEIQLGAAKDSGMTADQFAALLPEYQRYMALHAGYTGVSMLSDSLDGLHHAMILNTVRYASFCADVVGRFVHHLPCSSYPLYGVTPKEAGTICTDPPATCMDPFPPSPDPSPVPEHHPVASVDGPGHDDDDGGILASMHEIILGGARRTVGAYVASYGAQPPLDIWNHAIAYL